MTPKFSSGAHRGKMSQKVHKKQPKWNQNRLKIYLSAEKKHPKVDFGTFFGCQNASKIDTKLKPKLDARNTRKTMKKFTENDAKIVENQCHNQASLEKGGMSKTS